MPVVSLYRHGVTAGIPPMKNDHARALRGDCGGWSEGATRRNTQFLYSVDETQLHGQGFAVTLTLRECPPDSDAWHRLRRSFEARMRRAGMIRMHWVTEWQRRGVPHLHCALWFPSELAERWGSLLPSKVIGDWCLLASDFGAGWRGQDCHRITGAVGWFQYVSKHAARGMRHYQRSSENVPKAWQERTGRMWGHIGHWPVRERMRFDLQDQHGDRGFFAYRRLVRSWRIATCRPPATASDRRRLVQARGMLRCRDAAASRVRGVSEWAGLDLNLSFFANLAARGFSIVQRCDLPKGPQARATGRSVTEPPAPPGRSADMLAS